MIHSFGINGRPVRTQRSFQGRNKRDLNDGRAFIKDSIKQISGPSDRSFVGAGMFYYLSLYAHKAYRSQNSDIKLTAAGRYPLLVRVGPNPNRTEFNPSGMYV